MHQSLAVCALLAGTALSAPIAPVQRDELNARQFGGGGFNPFSFFPFPFPGGAGNGGNPMAGFPGMPGMPGMGPEPTGTDAPQPTGDAAADENTLVARQFGGGGFNPFSFFPFPFPGGAGNGGNPMAGFPGMSPAPAGTDAPQPTGDATRIEEDTLARRQFGGNGFNPFSFFPFPGGTGNTGGNPMAGNPMASFFPGFPGAAPTPSGTVTPQLPEESGVAAEEAAPLEAAEEGTGEQAVNEGGEETGEEN